jgi:hypothetical protein
MKYTPVDVAFGQSCINMNTDYGCRNNCIYCFGKNWNCRTVRFEPKEMVKKLLSKEEIGDVPLAINNSAADPFQPRTIDSSMELFSLLQDKCKNIMFITKEMIPDYALDEIEKSKLNVFIFVSYSALGKDYEHLVDERRDELLEKLHNRFHNSNHVFTVLYARPLISTDNGVINDLDKIIKASAFVNAVCWSSIRVDGNIKDDDNRNLLPEPTGDCMHKSHKRISDESFKYITEKLKLCHSPVFQKTSCTISNLLKISDFNCHWTDPKHYGCNNCTDEQRSICLSNSVKVPEFTDAVKNIISRYQLAAYVKSSPGAFVLDANDGKFSCIRAGILRKLTGFQVMFEDEGQLKTPENLAYEKYELRGDPIGNIPVIGFEKVA